MPLIGKPRSTQKLETGEAKIWILLVGVNNYDDESLPNLKYCAQDCRDLGQALIAATQRFPNKEIIVHHDELPLMTERAKILERLETFRHAAPKDTVLFYFSGHGVLESETQQPILCLKDTQKQKLAETGLTVQHLLNVFTSCQAQNQMIWLDACHSGGMTFKNSIWQQKGDLDVAGADLNPTSQLIDILGQRARQSKGFYAFLSCDKEQVSGEYQELGHGLFTYFLIKGLSGEAADSQGVIEADGLYKYIYHRILQYIDKSNQLIYVINQQQRRVDSGEYKTFPPQTPKRIVEGTGELVLGMISPSTQPQDLRQALIINGLSESQAAFTLSKTLQEAGGFKLEYLPQRGKSWDNIKSAIAVCLRSQNDEHLQRIRENTTALIYLRGKIEASDEGESWLVLGNEFRLSRSWFRQQLRQSRISQQIIIIDCPEATNLQEWVEDIQLAANVCQCIIGAISGEEKSERFAQALVQVLTADNLISGFTAAELISELQKLLRGSLQLHTWLSGAKGVIEVLLSSEETRTYPAFDSGICPYMGLNAFTKSDAFFFHGREALKQEILGKLQTASLLAVVGASGSGKSSVVQAGVLARLEEKGIFCPDEKEIKQCWTKSFRPGAKPIESLAIALASTKEEQNYIEGLLHLGVDSFVYWLRQRIAPMVVLVIDQFEELFTLTAENDRKVFLELILGTLEETSDRFKLIITLRSDFISSCLDIPKLADLVKQNNILVPPRLNEDEYREVIVKPAQNIGLSVEPGLVDLLLAEVEDSTGALPLLEFILEQLWEYRSEGQLTLKAYQEQIGGLKGVLEKKAVEAYEQLTDEQKHCAKWILLSLVNLGEGKEDTRRRLAKSELVAPKYSQALIESTLQALIAAKLIVVSPDKEQFSQVQVRGEDSVTYDEEVLNVEVNVEIAHEILIRNWSTLRWWLDENRQRLRLIREIDQDARKWKYNQQQVDFLLRGAALAQAEEVYIKYTDELSPDTQDFIVACLDLREQEKAKKEHQELERLQNQVALETSEKRNWILSKAVRRGTVILGASIFVASIASFSTFTAIKQQREAEKITKLEQASANVLGQFRVEEIQALVSAMKNGQALKSLVTQNRPLEDYPTISPVYTLHKILNNIHEKNRFDSVQGDIKTVIFSPKGQKIVTSGADGTVKIWNFFGQELAHWQAHQEGFKSLIFSPDGQSLATASYENDSKVIVWNLSGKKLREFQTEQLGVNHLTFSHDGKLMATAGADGTIRIYSLSGHKLAQWKTEQGEFYGVYHVSFSPDSKYLATAGQDGIAKVWDLSGKKLAELKNPQTKNIFSINFSPDGKTIATAGNDGIARLWDLSGKQIAEFIGHKGAITSISFSLDGERIITTGGDDFTTIIWDASGNQIAQLKGDQSAVLSHDVSRDSKYLVTAGREGIIRIWDLSNKSTVLHTNQYDINGVSFSPNGQEIVTVGDDEMLRLWTLSGEQKAQSKRRGKLRRVSFSPDGQRVAAIGDYNTIRLWNILEQKVNLLTIDNGSITSVSFSPDGKYIATTGSDETAKLWSLTGQKILELRGHQGTVWDVDFSSKGEFIATAGEDGTVRIWNHLGQEKLKLSEHQDIVRNIIFSPDDKILVTAGDEDIVRIWDINGKLKTQFNAYHGRINSVAFSPNGQQIATGGMDGTVRLWDLKGHQIFEFKGKGEPIRSLSFSSNGKYIVAGESKGNAYIWRLKQLDELLANACNWLEFYLDSHPKTREELYSCLNY